MSILDINSKLTGLLGEELDEAIEFLQKNNYYIPSDSLAKQEKIAFEKARLEYCTKLFEREMDRKNELEKKAQFYLSLVTILLGAILFKFDFFNTLKNLIQTKATTIPSFLFTLIYLLLFIVGFSILISLIAILGSISTRRYVDPSPPNFVALLFGMQSSKSILRPWFRSEENVLGGIAIYYAKSAEACRRINNEKAVWLQIASYATLVVTLSSTAFLGLVVYCFIV